jgi:short-subunit dehydrogenase
MELQQKNVLVVGATGVIGSGLAFRLAEEGARLALTGRRADALAEVAARVGSEHTFALDVVDVDACAAVVAAAAERLGGLDGLVVASGVAAFGAARDEQDVIVEELFAVNTFGPMALVRAAVPHLARGGAGSRSAGAGSAIAVLTAVLADVPTAGMAAYSASKAAASAYLTALRRELRREGVTVLDVRPPHLETGLADRALAGPAPRMPRAGDLDAVLDLVVQGIVEGRSELVADLSNGTVSLR